jgi:hypothetical protein
MRFAFLGIGLVTLSACSSGSSTTTTGSGGGTTSTTGSTTSTGATGAGGGSGGTCTMGAVVKLPPCTKPATTSVDVPRGCAPTVDGAYHDGEWSDATCITLGSDPIYLKYSGDTLYLAWPMTPSCGCPAQLAFNEDGAPTLDGMQFDLGIFDDPFTTTGDANEFVSTSGA